MHHLYNSQSHDNAQYHTVTGRLLVMLQRQPNVLFHIEQLRIPAQDLRQLLDWLAMSMASLSKSLRIEAHVLHIQGHDDTMP